MKNKKPSKRQKPNKHLGQNFLMDRAVKDRIIQSCQLQAEDCVLEIGPGEGALTELLISKVKDIVAIEADKKLAEKLQKSLDDSETAVEIRHQDFMQFDMTTLAAGTKIIGNLPYNLSSPIITKILENKNSFSEAFFTVQSEFGERLAAKENTKSYGAFTCFVQYHAKVELLFKIKNTAFWPVPKVQSCFLHITPIDDRGLTGKEESVLFKLVHESFKQRRKKLINSLLLFKPKEEWINLFQTLDIDPEARAENVSLETFISLAKMIAGATT